MKKTFTLLAVFTLILTLSGCQKNETSIDENDFEDHQQTQEVIQDETSSNQDESLINPEFKAAIDEYELFFDEYIAFMEKYNETDDPTSMMLDYLSYLAKFTETMESFSKIEENDMNEAETFYYLEVSTRILEKLAKVEL